MKKTTLVGSLLRWLGSTEMFARPSRQLPGKWQLFEYYYEPELQLIHVEEPELQTRNYRWNLHFSSEGYLHQESNIPVGMAEGLHDCKWGFSRGFIKIIDPDDPARYDKLQYAVDNGILKLLKKDADGKIIFFGFFRKIET